MVAEEAGSLPIAFINIGTKAPKNPATIRFVTIATARITPKSGLLFINIAIRATITPFIKQQIKLVGCPRNYGKTFRHGCNGTEISREEGVLFRRLDGMANSGFSFLGLGLVTNS